MDLAGSVAIGIRTIPQTPLFLGQPKWSNQLGDWLGLDVGLEEVVGLDP